eukprot:symbB.v1.2.003107.t1/scaffold151.1/size297192/6
MAYLFFLYTNLGLAGCELIAQAFSGDETANFELVLTSKDAHDIELLLNATPRKNARGDVAAEWLNGPDSGAPPFCTMASDESSVRVTINRISGDSQSCIAEQRETVGALKVRLADQLSVPPMCQRWIIEEPSLQTHEHVANCIAARQGLCCSCYSCCSSFCSIHFSP